MQQVNNPLPSYHEDNSVVRSQGLNTKNSENAKRPTKKKTRTRQPEQVYEHILAERRRREQLSQLFIALSAIVPGLKKTDKTSILGDAIEYLKNLKQRVQNLEQKSARKQAMDSGVTVKKSQLFVEDEEESKSGGSDEPEIEVRVVNNNILIRIHCGKQKGILANLLAKVESLNMVVVNTNVTPFGNSALDITIIAEVTYFTHVTKYFYFSIFNVAYILLLHQFIL
ncbi:transcription factor bhlh19 [Phtheirospermum japonicum]|uniref:Transcription factor bhlh19 n=1 Tax=Phtheirospermum japonicum TaxID=374723 RepID=A0A830BJF6_9LAMI|nr:transcription factor bhlh19 [Phtheirospermum japonicum]